MKKRRISLQVYSDFEHFKSLKELRDLSLYFGNLFEFYLPTYYTNIKKIVIELVNERDFLLIIPDDIISEVCIIRKSFDFSQFDVIDTKLKKELLFEFVFNCLKTFFEKIDFDLIELRNAKKSIIENNFGMDVTLCNTPIVNKAKVTAILIAEHHIEFALIKLIFIFKDGSKKEIHLFKTIPLYFIYAQIMNKVKWLNNDIVQLLNKEKDFIINISLSGEVACSYQPNNRDIEDIKNEIDFLTQESLFKNTSPII